MTAIYEPLFPYQQSAVERLAKGQPTYLAFDMGLGKTRTFIEAVRARNAKRVLILCPATAVPVWMREIERWHPQGTAVTVRKPTDFSYGHSGPYYYVLSHGLLSQKGNGLVEMMHRSKPFEMTALDEAHCFNAPNSLRTTAVLIASPNLGQIVPMSGTPMRNHAGDLFTLTNLCARECLRTSTGKTLTRYQYEEMFCRVSQRNFGGRSVRVIDGSKNLGALKAALSPFMLRVRKEEVRSDLPPIMWNEVPVTPDLKAIPPGALDNLDADLATAIKGGLENLRNDVHLMTMRRFLGMAKTAPANAYITDLLDNLPEHEKVLVFAVHKQVIEGLANHLGEFDPAIITGSTSPTMRGTEVDKFLTERSCRVFIGNIQAAGTAITLVGPTCRCSHVVFVESSWTSADNVQAACRIHRIGQLDAVTAHMLYADGSVDSQINAIVSRKAREFTQLFEANKEKTQNEAHV